MFTKDIITNRGAIVTFHKLAEIVAKFPSTVELEATIESFSSEGNYLQGYPYLKKTKVTVPFSAIGNNFSKLLDKYPVSPYLEGKDSFLKWVHFIHNKVNVEIGKDEITYTEAVNTYHELYKPKEIIMREQIKYRKKLLFTVILILLTILGYYLYKK